MNAAFLLHRECSILAHRHPNDIILATSSLTWYTTLTLPKGTKSRAGQAMLRCK